MTKKTNNVLPNGLYIMSIKKRIDHFVLLSMHDFNSPAKVWFDLKENKMMSPDVGVKFTEPDFKVIKDYVENNSK